MVTRVLHLHHLNDLLHGLASSSHRAREMVTAGAQETEAGHKVHSSLGAWGGGAAGSWVLTPKAPAVVRWFTTSNLVLPTLSRGVLVLWWWREFSISHHILTNLLPRSN